MTQPVDPTVEFNRRIADDPELRDCVRGLNQTDPAAAYRDYGIARPVFGRLEELERLSAHIKTTVTVMDSLPGRYFGGSIDDYVAGQGYPPVDRQSMAAGLVGSPTDLGRADVFRDRDGFRVLELNMGSPLGGLSTTTLNRSLLGSEAFRRFATELGLGWIDPVSILVDDLRALGRTQVGTDAPVVAVIEETGAGGANDRIVSVLRGRGVDATYATFDALEFVGGKVHVGSRPVDVVMRYFFVQHVSQEEDGMATMRRLVEAHREGRTGLFTSFDPEIHESKAAVGLLFEPEVRRLLSADEAACIDLIMPWTRLLGPAFPTVSTTERAALVDECRSRRADLVLKPANLHASRGVVLGDQVDDATWRDLLTTMPHADYLVQERVHPVAESVLEPRTGTTDDWTMLWHVFFGSAGYGGASVRAKLRHHLGPVGGNGHTTSGCVFTY